MFTRKSTPPYYCKTHGRDEANGIIRAAVRENSQSSSNQIARMLVDTQPDKFNGSMITLERFVRRIRTAMESEALKELATKEFTVSKRIVERDGDGAIMWALFEEMSDLYLDEHLNENKSIIHIDTSLPIGICFKSDQHMGNSGTDHKRMREDALLIANTDGMFSALGGDGMDNFIKTKLLDGIINAKSSPSDQYKAFRFYLSLFSHKILFAISGNHEYWTKLATSFDIVKQLCEENKILYSPHDFHVDIFVGAQRYKIYLRHIIGKFNSAMNPLHSIKQQLRFGDYDFDIGVAAHTHTAGMEEFEFHKTKRVALRPGSYKIIDSFGEQYGFKRALPTSPVIILFPDRKEMIPFSDLRMGAQMLSALREEYKRKGVKSNNGRQGAIGAPNLLGEAKKRKRRTA